MKDFFLRILSWMGARLAAFWGGFFLGAEKQKRKKAEHDLEAIRDAKDIHDRVELDDTYHKRVRDEFR